MALSEGAIRKIMKNHEGIQKRSALMPEEGKKKPFEHQLVGFLS